MVTDSCDSSVFCSVWLLDSGIMVKVKESLTIGTAKNLALSSECT